MRPTISHHNILILFTYFCIGNASAVCQITRPAASIEFSYSGIEATEVSSLNSFYMDGLTTQFGLKDEFWQLGHEYVAYDYDRDNLTTPVTNGDLHNVVLGFKNEMAVNDKGNIYWELLPTLAVSSNQLKNPDKINSRSLRLDGHIVWPVTGQESGILYLGGCTTALTGEYELIPVVIFDIQLSSWEFYIGYPHTEIKYLLTGDFNFVSGWSLSGNQWQVFDENLVNRNDVHFKSKQLRLGLVLNVLAAATLELYWTYDYDQEFEYLARNQLYTSQQVEAVKGWVLKYKYLF